MRPEEKLLKRIDIIQAWYFKFSGDYEGVNNQQALLLLDELEKVKEK